MAPGKKPMVPPEWSRIKLLFRPRIQDAAKALGVSESYLKILCRKNGIQRWPGQRIRSLVDQLQMLGREAAARQGAQPGEEAEHRPRAMIAKDISEVVEEMTKLLQITDCALPGLQACLDGNGTTTAAALQGDSGLPIDSDADLAY